MGKVLKCGKEIELTGIPLLHLQLTEVGVRRQGGRKERKRGRGRKREDILRGKAVIYEQATSNKQGGGGHSFSNKTRGGREEKRLREKQRFKERGVVQKSKVEGKLVNKAT